MPTHTGQPLGRSSSAPEPHQDPPQQWKVKKVKSDVVAGTQHVQDVAALDWLEHPHSFVRGMWHAFLATAIFRCWHLILFMTAEAAIVTYFNRKDDKFKVDGAMVTVLGTFIGFIISLRTSASFERYHDGRKFWSQLSHNALQLGRMIWFHVPENKPTSGQTAEEARARTIIEKKTIINLIEAFAVAVKHHLRGEQGVYYEDLYHLVKMLPAYSMESGVLSPVYTYGVNEKSFQPFPHPDEPSPHDFTRVGTARTTKDQDHLPLPATANQAGSLKQRHPATRSAVSLAIKGDKPPEEGDAFHLLPARNPPSTTIFDVWPFSMFVRVLQAGGAKIRGKKAQRVRAERMRYGSKSHNVPMEISLYISSYIRKCQAASVDGLILAQLMDHSKNLMDANVGLERIQTTPIPYSYGVHLWTITLLYLLLLPFQLAQSLVWLTPVASALAAFAYCGLLKAGDEIEQPFGYDYNDLNLDHFTKHIIRRELRALTAMPVHDPAEWIFSPENDTVFDDPMNSRLHPSAKTKRRHPEVFDHTAQLRRMPEVWVHAGEVEILRALAVTGGVDADAGMLKAADLSGAGAPTLHAASPGLRHVPATMTLAVPRRQPTDPSVAAETT